MRKIWDIHGGIHPPENKTQSLGSDIAPASIPNQLVLPLSQHLGAPAKPVVAVDDYVLKGQCIAEANGPVSVPVHASSSGKVIAIERRPIPHASGLDDLCIVIATDGKDQWCERMLRSSMDDLDNEALLQIIHNAGIAGMGGAGFPSAVKLNPPADTNIETLIINCTECEPYITSDHALLRERSQALAEGIGVLAKLIQPKEILVGIEDNKLDTVDGVKQSLSALDLKTIAGRDIAAEVVTFPTKYPSGGEKQLIEIVTGKQVPSGGLPADIGIVCQNAGTAVAIADAVYRDEPLIRRITTLTGNTLIPNNYDVLLGTPIQHLLDRAKRNSDLGDRIIMGGPMMGFTLTSTEVPAVKTTNCILAPTFDELPTPPPAQPCIRCGMCAEACPASLLPQQLYWFAKGKELEKLEQHNLADCIECGACSYVCPSNIPLVQYYRASKAEIRQRDTDMKNAEYAKIRFEARQARLERLEQEKIAARAARKAKAAAKQKAKAADKDASPGSAKPNDASQDKASPNKTNNNDKAAKAAAIAAAVERANKKKAERAEQAEKVDAHTATPKTDIIDKPTSD